MKPVNRHGQSLVAVLVSVAILGIIIMITATMFDYQNREARALSEKLSALDLQRTLTSALANSTACNATVNPANLISGQSLTFGNPSITSTSPTSPNVIAELSNVFSTDGISSIASSTSGAPISPLSNTLTIQSKTGIEIGGYLQSGQINYELLINFDQTKLVRPIKNLILPVSLATTGSTTITGCGSSAGDWVAVPVTSTDTSPFNPSCDYKFQFSNYTYWASGMTPGGTGIGSFTGCVHLWIYNTNKTVVSPWSTGACGYSFPNYTVQNIWQRCN